MNERIQELIAQATSIVESPKNAYGWGSSYAYFDKEKFAELIVQKCADIGQRYADGNYEVPNQILEYFGMEE